MNKDILLDYVAGKIQEGQPSGDHTWQYSEEYSETNILDDTFTYGFNIINTIQCKDSKGNELPYNIIYGNYSPEEDAPASKGFLLLTDRSLKEIQLLTQYSSGTDFSKFIFLEVDEKGQLYGLDDNNGTKRFIMLNNVSAKLPTQEFYSCSLRQSYNLPDKIKNDYFSGIKKSPASSNYLIVSHELKGRTTFTNLEVVVGASNNWTYYDHNGDPNVLIEINGIYGTWGENTFTFKAANTTNIFITDSEASITYNEIVVSSSSTTPTEHTYTTTIPTENIYADESGIIYLVNEETTYLAFTYENEDNEDMMVIAKVNYTQNKIDYLYKFDYNSHADGISIEPYLKDNIKVLLVNYFTASLTFLNAILIENDRYETICGTPEGIQRGTTASFSITKEFDLLTNTFRADTVLYWLPDTPSGTSFFTSRGIYGTDTYARTPYESINGLVPNYISLEEDNKLVFARRLYNNSITNNIMTSTVDIPNSMLNDSSIIELDKLGSITNVKINLDNIGSFNKNMYEEVFVNVLTEFQFKNDDVRDRTNENTIMTNVFSASNYQNQKISKCDIIYVDNTTKELSLEYTKIKNYYQVNIVFFVDKPIKEIQFKSENGTIIYATNDLSSLQTNKIYKIRKDIWCSDKQAVELVYYDNEQVYYGDYEVYY